MLYLCLVAALVTGQVWLSLGLVILLALRHAQASIVAVGERNLPPRN